MKKSSPSTKLSKRRIVELQNQAATFAEQKQWKEAAFALSQLAQNQRDDAELWLRTAQCQRFARDYNAAAQTLQNALVHFSFGQSNTATPNVATPNVVQTKTELSKTQTPKSPTSSTRSSGERERNHEIEMLRLALCETWAEGQNWSACENVCRDLIAFAPRHLAAREILATCLLQQGRVEAAENEVRTLLKMSPRDPLYRLKLATLLQLSGKSGESLQEFERVVANYPDAPFANEAREAIDLLDNLQIQQVVMRLNEQPQFEQQLRADMSETLSDNGFKLTDEGRESLRHMMSDGRLEAAPPKMFLH